jgi:hypothetical protein
MGKTKLTLAKARKVFEHGGIVYLKPSRITEQAMDKSPWFSWCECKKSDYIDESITFDKIVNKYYYNNCNKETGLRVNYYAYL